MNSEHVVYRMFGDDDELLYIGATSSLHDRLSHHRQYTPWFGDVCRVTSTPFPDRRAAFTAEAAAIRAEQPLHNVSSKDAEEHGYSRYAHGCRCDICKRAKAEYARARRRALRAVGISTAA